jgi:hypothetical protein
MAGFNTNTNEHLIRSELWSSQLKSLLMDELIAMKYVRTLDVPSDAGSSTFNIPSMGEAEVSNFVEGDRVKYNKFDEGNYTFTFDQYKYSANSISEKYKRDSFYSDQVIAAFLPRQHRAIMVDYEIRILSVANSSQTPSVLNTINGGDHRWVGSASTKIDIDDFAKAQYSLKRSNVPMTNLVAIVDPSVIYTLQTQTNLTNFLSPVPRWNNMVSNVTPTGMKFEMNIFGFDVYSSNYLPNGITETVSGDSVTSNGVANYFFSAAGGDILPWVGAWRQHPTVYSEFNKDTQETEYMTICEYGVQGDYRPENLITVLTAQTIS